MKTDTEQTNGGAVASTDGLGRLRQTGRTTRMLEHAKKLSSEGRAVYVVADNQREVQRLTIELGEGKHGIKVETPESLGNLDWKTMTLRGAHPNCVVLCDHHTIEDRFGAIVRMLHAYDAP